MTAQVKSTKLQDAGWLTQGPLARLLALLDRDGEEARVVGGAVRNALIGESLGEIDVATTARPEEVVRRVQAAGLKAVPTGIDHGTVTVIFDGVPFEVTTLREDVETFGRKATVRFGRDWKADAERRDFTMNALSASRDGKIYDYISGLSDLQARRVRFIGDPETRIREDYLRILRFFRFHAAYGRGALDRNGLHAAIALRHGLEHLSRERVRMEMFKLLLAPGAAPTLSAMVESGILDRVLGGVPIVAHFARMVGIECELGLTPDPIRRLGVLAVHVLEDADRLWTRLRLANVEHERLASMAESWWRVSDALDEKSARALLYRLKLERYTDRVTFAWARAESPPADARWRNLAQLPRRWQAAKFPLRAADFIARGVPKGPALGATLNRAEEAWIAADFPSDPETLARLADDAIRQRPV